MTQAYSERAYLLPLKSNALSVIDIVNRSQVRPSLLIPLVRLRLIPAVGFNRVRLTISVVNLRQVNLVYL